MYSTGFYILLIINCINVIEIFSLNMYNSNDWKKEID